MIWCIIDSVCEGALAHARTNVHTHAHTTHVDTGHPCFDLRRWTVCTQSGLVWSPRKEGRSAELVFWKKGIGCIDADRNDQTLVGGCWDLLASVCVLKMTERKQGSCMKEEKNQKIVLKIYKVLILLFCAHVLEWLPKNGKGRTVWVRRLKNIQRKAPPCQVIAALRAENLHFSIRPRRYFAFMPSVIIHAKKNRAPFGKKNTNMRRYCLHSPKS